MNPTCNATSTAHFKEHYCTEDSGHTGNHRDRRTEYTWPDTPTTYAYVSGRGYGKTAYADRFKAEYKTGVLGVFDEPQPETVMLKLTLTDLKTIAYYMAEEEDGDKTKIKIDEALKEML